MMPSADWKGRFLTIWGGQQLAQIGSTVATFALLLWIMQEIGSATVLGIASMLAFIPLILFGPFIGALVDRWDRRRILILSNAIVSLTSVCAIFLFRGGAVEIWHIYALSLAYGFAHALHAPAMTASIALLAPPRHFARIEGLSQIISAIVSAVSVSIGALLPLQIAMTISAVAPLVGIVALLFRSIPLPEGSRLNEIRAASVWSNTRTGLRTIFRWPGLLALAGIIVATQLAMAPALSLSRLLLLEPSASMGSDPDLYQVIAGAGTFAGGLLLAAWGGFRRRLRTIVLGLAGVGAGTLLIGIALPSTTWLLSVGAGTVGLMVALATAGSTAILQATVPVHIQGRVFGTFESLITLASRLSVPLAVLISSQFTVRFCFLLTGAACLVLSAVALRVRSLRDFENQASPIPQSAEVASVAQD